MDCVLFYGNSCNGEQDCIKNGGEFDELCKEWENCEWIGVSYNLFKKEDYYAEYGKNCTSIL